MNNIKKALSSLSYLIYRIKWNFYPKYNIISKFPFHVDIETTDACNLKCIMCVHGTTGVSNPGMIDTTFAKDLINQVASNGGYSIKFNWRGEPTLHKDLIELVSYAKKKGILEVQINTNGIPLNKEKIEKLIEAGLDRIIFSVDGASKEIYEKIRVGAKYKQLVDNIITLSKYKKKINATKPLIRVQMIKMTVNENEVEDLFKLWRPYVNEIKINDITDRGQGNSLSVGNKVLIGRKKCPQPWQRMVVAYDGKVLPCCADWNFKWIIGDASKLSLKKIWNSTKMKNIRYLINKYKLDEFEPCKSCFSGISYNYENNTKN